MPCNGMPTSDRMQAITKVVTDISGTRDFDDPEHPVYKALYWMVDEDLLYLCPDDDNLEQRYVLVLLYFSTSGDNWMKCRRDGLPICNGKNFLSETHECEWGGITCDSLNRVKNINLDDSNLKGGIPNELSILEYVEELDFDSNRITGRIPAWLGELQYLERLDLDRNFLSGPIPEELYDSPSLRYIDMDRNILSGTISTKIGLLNQLVFFQVDFNQMKGRVPTELGVLADLQFFSILGNGFDDSGIPLEMCGNNIQIYANCGMCEDVGDCCTACLAQ
jgi:hypothetical protein